MPCLHPGMSLVAIGDIMPKRPRTMPDQEAQPWRGLHCCRNLFCQASDDIQAGVRGFVLSVINDPLISEKPNGIDPLCFTFVECCGDDPGSACFNRANSIDCVFCVGARAIMLPPRPPPESFAPTAPAVSAAEMSLSNFGLLTVNCSRRR